MSFKFFASAAALLGAAALTGGAFAAEAAKEADKAAPPAADGSALFTQNCSACHQPKGEGVAGAFPALAGNKFVQGDAKGPAWVLTHGRGGMPNFSEDMSDAEIATVLSFIRASWGNKAEPVDAATVASVRGAPAPPDTAAGLPFH